MKSGLDQYFEEVLLSPTTKLAESKTKNKFKKVTRNNSNKISLSQYFEKELLEETTADERMQKLAESSDFMYDEADSDGDEDEEIDIYTSYASYMSSSDPGSDNLLVTFDYGSQDSLDGVLCFSSQQLELVNNEICNGDDLDKNLFKIPEEENSEELIAAKDMEMHLRSSNIFEVHQVQHEAKSSSSINNRTNSCISVATSLVECDIDTSGDYGSWAQSESEHEEGEGEGNATTCRNYRYEDLIKTEVVMYDDDDGNDIINGHDGREALIKFNFDEDLPPRWFSNNDQLYYRSVDYLN